MEVGWHIRHRRITADNPAIPGNIDEPILFSSGQFIGRTIRFELHELQKADSGRKEVLSGISKIRHLTLACRYAKVDRRTLDPPPAVHLRIFEVLNTESGQWEREFIYEYWLRYFFSGNIPTSFSRQIQNIGFLCSLDLFPVPDSVYQQRSHASLSPPGSLCEPHQVNQPTHPFTYFPLHVYTSPSSRSQIQFQLPFRQLVLDHLKGSKIPPDVVHKLGNHLVTESSKMTPAVVGEKVVEPALVDYKGRKALIFMFGDVSIRREGVFILRYRVFDISSIASGGEDLPVFAKLYGGPFKVYSSRDFPGLGPSTDLTKTLSKCGVRVTIRDAERKSKKRSKSKESE